jgi:hypothetical protein
MDASGGGLPVTSDRCCVILSHGSHQDDLVRHSANWHEEGGTPLRPEDVIVAAFVQLRRIAVSHASCHLASLNSDFFFETGRNDRRLLPTQGYPWCCPYRRQ